MGRRHPTTRSRRPLGTPPLSGAWTPSLAFGADLWTWLRPGLGASLSTVGEWRKSDGSALYTQATKTTRPAAVSVGADFDATDDILTAGSSVLTSNAFTAYTDFQIDDLPGVGAYRTAWQFLQSATPTYGALYFLNIGGYQPIHFGAKITTVGSARVGIVDALTTARRRLAITYNGGTVTDPASYGARLDGVTKTVVASGNSAITAVSSNSLGGRADTANVPLGGRVYERTVYSRVLTSGEIDVLDAWFSTHSGPDPSTISGLVEWIRPDLALFAGDCSALPDQGPNGNHFANPTLSTQPYLDGTWAHADGKRAIRGVAGTSKLSHADAAVFAGATRLFVAFWIKQPTGAIAEMIGQLASTDHSWWTYIHTTGGLHHRMALATSASDTATYGAMPGGSFVANTWTHIAWRFRGSGVGNAARLQGFVNGTAVALTFSGTIPASLRNSAGEIDLFDITTAGLIGSLDDIVVVTGRDVSDGEVARLANYYRRTG